MRRVDYLREFPREGGEPEALVVISDEGHVAVGSERAMFYMGANEAARLASALLVAASAIQGRKEPT